MLFFPEEKPSISLSNFDAAPTSTTYTYLWHYFPLKMQSPCSQFPHRIETTWFYVLHSTWNLSAWCALDTFFRSTQYKFLMTLFSVENSKSVNLVLTPYGNRRIRSYSLQNVRSWYVLSSRLRFCILLPTICSSTQSSVQCTTRGVRDKGIPKVDA
jgi:hypothetical protein